MADLKEDSNFKISKTDSRGEDILNDLVSVAAHRDGDDFSYVNRFW